MKVITLLNEKGGVGKTTLAVHIAEGLAAKYSLRAMLIDADPQGHSTRRCAWTPKAPGFYDLLVRGKNFMDVAVEIPGEKFGIPDERLPDGRLWVIPSNIETRNIAASISDADALALRLDELHDLIDVVVIDTSPTPSLLHGAIYTATDAILYPTKLEMMAFDGLVESITHRMAADEQRKKRWGIPPMDVLGIVPIAYRKGTIEQDRNLSDLIGHFGSMVWDAVPQRTLWTEAESQALPVYMIAPFSPAAAEAWQMIDRVAEKLGVVNYVQA